MRFMTSLQELKIVTTTKIASKLQGADSYIISNIPSINLVGLPYSACFEIRARRFVDGVRQWAMRSIEKVKADISEASSSSGTVEQEVNIFNAELTELIQKAQRARHSGSEVDGASFLSEFLELTRKKRNAPLGN
ncbi:UNVERIFIED_CONTAM: hypothetical protein Sradi_6169500 [Sesamum radiatum]|uniref:Uncharacterized protein n=1 Tax=Sesamum radiatum TaxID=300843 RepID=A0AAW2K7Z6_SESRA